MTNRPDILAAETLLLTVLIFLYTLWFPKVDEAIRDGNHLKGFRSDNRSLKNRTLSVRDNFAAPLAVGFSVLTLIFLPDSVRVILDTIVWIKGRGAAAVADYDAVATALVVANIASLFITLRTWAHVRVINTVIANIDNLPEG